MTDRRSLLAAASVAAIATFAGPTPVPAASRRPATRLRMKDGTEIYVEDSGGVGRPVVFLHAWPLSSEIWQHQRDALAQAGHRVIACDRRGFGRSSPSRSGYDFDLFADDLASVIDKLALRDAVLVGYSMGGGEVVRYFSRHEGRGVAKAALVGAAANLLVKAPDNPDGIDATVFDGIKAGVRGDRRAYLAVLLKDVFFDLCRPATTPVSALALQHWLDVALQADLEATVACVDAFNATDFRPELAAVRVPALVLHGTADIPVPIALARATARGMAGSKLIEYEGVSHGLVVTEAERVTRDLLAFLV